MPFLQSNKKLQLSEAEMLRVYRLKGDLNVLAELYQGYMDLVYGVCLKYYDDRESARDAVMQIFEELSIKLKTHEVEHFKSWLFTVARNYCLMQLRSPRNLKTTELDASYMQSEPDSHLNGVMEKEENLERMKACIEQLPETQKEAVQLFYLQEKSYQEIANLTGRDWNQVRSFIQNGRRNLRLCMQENDASKNPQNTFTK